MTGASAHFLGQKQKLSYFLSGFDQPTFSKQIHFWANKIDSYFNFGKLEYLVGP